MRSLMVPERAACRNSSRARPCLPMRMHSCAICRAACRSVSSMISSSRMARAASRSPSSSSRIAASRSRAVRLVSDPGVSSAILR